MSATMLSFEIPSAPRNAAAAAALSCLGNVENNRPNQIPPDSVYGRLPRPATIPHKERHRGASVLLSPTTLPEQAHNTYTHLWDEDFVCTIDVHDNCNITLRVSIATSAESDDNGGNKKEAFWGVVMSFCSISLQPHSQGETYVHMDVPFWRILTNDQQVVLFWRVLHRLLRTHGLFVPLRFVVAFRNLMVRQYLDAAIIEADVAVNSGSSQNNTEIFNAVGRVGEILEAKGNYQHAADVYLELITVWDVPKDKWISCYNNAALAFKRSKDFELSEENYLNALLLTHETGATCTPSWNLKDDCIHGLFQRLLILYFETVDASISAGTMTDEKSAFLAVFLGLLHFAGFQPKNDKLREEFIFQQERLNVSTIVTNKFKSSRQAKRVLLTATKSTNVQGFRTAILSCWKRGRISTYQWPAWMSASVDTNEKHKKAATKMAARSIVSAGAGKMGQRCSEPTCTVIELQEEFMSCPCETVQYCSTECQRRHWRGEGGHRLSCPCRSK